MKDAVLVDLRFDSEPGQGRFAAQRNEELAGIGQACQGRHEVEIVLTPHGDDLLWVAAIKDVTAGVDIVPRSEITRSEQRDRIAGWVFLVLAAFTTAGFGILAFRAPRQLLPPVPKPAVPKPVQAAADPKAVAADTGHDWAIGAGALITLASLGLGGLTLLEFHQLETGTLTMVKAWGPMVAAYRAAGLAGPVLIVALGVGVGLWSLAIGLRGRASLRSGR